MKLIASHVLYEKLCILAEAYIRICIFNCYCTKYTNMHYGTAQFRLEGKLRAVIRAHAMMCVTLLVFSSASTRKTTCLKKTCGYILCKQACTN